VESGESEGVDFDLLSIVVDILTYSSVFLSVGEARISDYLFAI